MQVNGFPIIDNNERLVGLISRNDLIVLIKNKIWMDVDPNLS